MTTYKELKGTQIQVVSSDPDNPIEGQVWYNSTSNALKGFKLVATGSWSTGGSLNAARRYVGTAAADSSSGIGFGGNT